jgi:hypothetical protein
MIDVGVHTPHPFMAFMRDILKIRILLDFLYLPIPFMAFMIDAKITLFRVCTFHTPSGHL